MDPFCMLDAAAIGPVAADHVSTVHRAREPSRNAVSGDHYIGVLGENFTDRVTGGIKRHGRRQRVVHHCAPARGAMGPGEALDNFHCLERSWGSHQLRSEEHTSELQSLMRISYAVFCLKKKKHIMHIIKIYKLHYKPT